MKYFLVYLLIINLIAFFMMGVDKGRAVRAQRRIPEKTLFGAAALGGGIGGLLGMYAFRHKTLHRSFTLGFPAIILMEYGLILFGYLRYIR